MSTSSTLAADPVFSCKICRDVDDNGVECVDCRAILFQLKSDKTAVTVRYEANRPLSDWTALLTALGGSTNKRIVFDTVNGEISITYRGEDKTVTFHGSKYGGDSYIDTDVSVDYSLVQEPLRLMVEELATLPSNDE